MEMISYAQNHEDVILNRLFPSGYIGFYVDIGANHPVNCSLTKHFYDQGWSGINVEPGQVFDLLRKTRLRDINLRQAISNFEGCAAFHEFPTRTTDSTLERRVAEANRASHAPFLERVVEVVTLRGLCEGHVGSRTIDFMSIDVEGHEWAVIESGDWRRFRPRVLLVEATLPNSRQSADLVWEPMLLRHGYHFALFDGLNRFYVREEDGALLPLLHAPVCIFDKFTSYHTLASYGGLPPGSASLQIGLLFHKVARNIPRLAAPFRPLVQALRRRPAA